MGVCNVVCFSPEDLKLLRNLQDIEGDFLTWELCQLDRKYYYNLVQYNKVLMGGNTILKGNRVDQSILDMMINWLLFGEYVIKRRIWYINQLNNYGKSIHKEITSNKEDVEFGYFM